MSLPRTHLAAAAFLALSLGSAVASADPAVAQNLFKEGLALANKGEFAAACKKFAASNVEERSVDAFTGLGVCNEKQGKLATAWAAFNDAANLARSLKDDRYKSLQERAAGIEPKLSRLTLNPKVALPENAVVRRNGVDVSRGALGTAIPVDPGEQAVEITADGFKPWKGSIKVGENGDKQTLDLPALEKDPNWKPKEPAPGPGQRENDGSALRIAGFVVGGVGVVGLGVGAVMGGLAASDKSNAETDPALCGGGSCTDTGRQVVEDARTKALVSTVLLPVGGTLLAGGVVLLVVGTLQGKKSDPNKQGIPVLPVPFVGERSAGLVAVGRF